MSFYIGFLCLSAIFAIVTGVTTYTSKAISEGRRPTKGPRYTLGVSQQFFHYYPFVIFYLILEIFLLSNPTPAIFLVALVIMAFQCILILIQPFLRKIYTANTCATLWITTTVPVFLAINSDHTTEKAWIISVPIQISDDHLMTFNYVWILVFALVFSVHILRHMIFRKKLLKDAQPAGEEITRVWEKEAYYANVLDREYPVMVSPTAQTPLSIGLFQATTVVVLPETNYSEEELKLIFRHELVHLCRKDSQTKFGILFFTALFWFNPLMWIAMRRCSEDLELGCDETVLYSRDQALRHRYASLLLNTAAQQQGFTTCLSATAKSLRYRLKNVVNPGKRITGGVLCGLFCFVLLLSITCVNISYNPGTIGQQVFRNQDPQDYIIHEMFGSVNSESFSGDETANPELLDYLFRIPVSQLIRQQDPPSRETYAQIHLYGNDESYTFRLYDNYLRVITSDDRVELYYRVEAPVDWTLLSQQASK